MRQALAQEYEQVKDIHSILQSFKADDGNQRQAYIGRDFTSPTRYEEPTRDPDVWPPPTPVEHKFVSPNSHRISLVNCGRKFPVAYPKSRNA